ncbi:hypothetical protein B0H15DRAFT_777606 [Mycena belliarum]|uniref:Uncharacterized protein n=1 Tax=Mycena belliarum TaxID=1033014 RepID=A0AAD6XW71_9AGAR|nr:hypothetical protein B0H15DRAFT_777606 [Mycena belliae]
MLGSSSVLSFALRLRRLPFRVCRRIDLGNAPEDDLSALASACKQATFGVDQLDVLDESYRKAGKMDLSKFSTRMDVVASGLVVLRSFSRCRRTVRVFEQRGDGSYFKSHVF